MAENIMSSLKYGKKTFIILSRSYQLVKNLN